MSARSVRTFSAGVLVVVGTTMWASSVASAGTRGAEPAVVTTTTVATPDPATLVGSQGIDTSIADTPSALTVHGRGDFASLAVHVNQTRNLTNQSISLTWSGAHPTVQGPGRFGQHFLQIFQCWGDDDGTNPDNPGPPPEQCEQGAVAGQYSGLPTNLYPQGFGLYRVISRPGWPNYDPHVGVLDSRDHTNVWLPFRAVDGTVVNEPVDANFNPSVSGGNYWLNPYYNIITTNEIAGAATGPDGTGAELFQTLTGTESAGLGCGAKVQPVQGGGTKIPKCWLVVVPRGSAASENAGTPFDANLGVYTSPVSPSAWAHRIAIPLEFNPIDSPCNLGADQLRISGSELALAQVASWQVALCAKSDLLPFSYAPMSDDSARMQMSSNAPGGPGMIVVSKPMSTANADPSNPVVYSPMSVSGIVVGFNLERVPSLGATYAEQQLAGIRVANIHLTPRLVAKLLTQSYAAAVSLQGQTPYPWVRTAPSNIVEDPDFLRFNPEFTQLQSSDRRALSGLSLEAGNSDAVEQVWKWIFADPEARAFMAGTADKWGMKVNPAYLTTSANSIGIPFGSPLPNYFPKADPYCFQAADITTVVPVRPPVLCGTDWNPYSRSFFDSARITRIAYDGAKIAMNPTPASPADVWQRDSPQLLGTRVMFSITDTPSAVQFGVQMASLSAAGDDTDSRTFVAPNTAALEKGLSTMVASGVPGVLQADPSRRVAGAYPLTAVTYAAVKPLALSTTIRRQYAEFLDYARGVGQVQGLELGQLPRGYAPLSATMRAQVASAASRIRTMQAPPTTTTTTTTYYMPPVIDTTTTVAPVDSSTTTSSVAATSTTVATTSSSATTTLPPVLTPSDPPSSGGFALPGLGLAAAGSALGALELTKRPRRRKAVS